MLAMLMFTYCDEAGEAVQDPEEQNPDGTTDPEDDDPDDGDEDDGEEEEEEEERAPIVYGDGPLSTLPDEVDILNGWSLTWNDEFDYTDMADFEAVWTYNTWGGTAGLCHRTADNVSVSGGILYLLGKVGSDGVCTYSTGSVQTKKSDFKYGYYEARMKYAKTTGVNNSFWFWNGMPEAGYDYPYEIDMCEGHYPNIINTNQHYRWYVGGNSSDTRVNCGYTNLHYVDSNGPIDVTPQSHITYKTPIKTKKIRLTSKDPFEFHIREIKMFAPNSDGYPTEWVESGNNSYFDDQYASSRTDQLVNHAKNATVTTNNAADDATDAYNMIDEKSSTSWDASPDIVEKEIIFEFDSEVEIGHIQLITGWYYARSYKSYTSDLGVAYSEWVGNDDWYKPLAEYTIEYYDGTDWVVATDYDNANGFNLADGFHNYGIYWDEDKIVIYFDGYPIRTIDYDECIDSSNVPQCWWNNKLQPVWSENTLYLSMLVLDGGTAGVVSDDIIGTSQQIEWVRVYQKSE